jgi:hypothetical protein
MKLHMHKNRKKQRGIATVEFAIAGFATLAVIFAAIEMSRLMFTHNTLTEASRRGARVAAVCNVADQQEIQRLTIFNTAGSGGQSPILRNLTTDNVVIEYLDADGNVIPNIAGPGYFSIEYVRVRIVNFRHNFIFPGIDLNLNMPEYPTTVPRESLGVARTGQVTTCA